MHVNTYAYTYCMHFGFHNESYNLIRSFHNIFNFYASDIDAFFNFIAG